MCKLLALVCIMCNLLWNFTFFDIPCWKPIPEQRLVKQDFPVIFGHIRSFSVINSSKQNNHFFSIIGSCWISIWYFHHNDNQQNISTILCILLHVNFWTDFNCSKFAHCPVSRRWIFMDEGRRLGRPGHGTITQF